LYVCMDMDMDMDVYMNHELYILYATHSFRSIILNYNESS